MVRNDEYELKTEDIDLMFKCLDLLSAAIEKFEGQEKREKLVISCMRLQVS